MLFQALKYQYHFETVSYFYFNKFLQIMLVFYAQINNYKDLDGYI